MDPATPVVTLAKVAPPSRLRESVPLLLAAYNVESAGLIHNPYGESALVERQVTPPSLLLKSRPELKA